MATTQGSVADVLDRWRNNLIDWSVNNPYLSLSPDPEALLLLSQPEPGTIFESLVKRGQSYVIWAPPASGVRSDKLPACQPAGAEKAPGFLELVSAELDRDRLLLRLARLQRLEEKARFERGHNVLFLAFGLLSWQDLEEQAYRSPLVLLPVSLRRKTPADPFELVHLGAEPRFNPVLQMRLERDLQMAALPWPETWEDRSLADYFRELEGKIADLPQGKIEESAHLLALPAFKGAALKDLEDYGQPITAHRVVRVLAGELPAETLAGQPWPDEDELDAVQDPENSLWVLDADGSQRLGLEAAARGNSFVLLGAPGTGKRQTIVNLVADAIARGKKILIAGERLPALEDLTNRLEKAGLGEPCLPIFRALISASPSPAMSPVETRLALTGVIITPNEARAQDPHRLKQCRDYLNAYVRQLHEVREPLRQSVWWALNELTRWRDLPSLPLGLALYRSELGTAEHMTVLAEITPGWLAEARQAVARLQEVWKIRQKTDFPWWGFKADRFSKQVRDAAVAVVDKVKGRVEHLLATAEQYGTNLGCKGPVSWLLKAGELLEAQPGKVPALWLLTGDLDGVRHDLEKCAEEYQRLGQARGPLSQRYGPTLWQVPDGTAAQAAQAWRAAAALFSPADERGAGLLSHQQQLRGWAADTQKRIPGWIAEARALEKWLAIPLSVGAGSVAEGGHAGFGELVSGGVVSGKEGTTTHHSPTHHSPKSETDPAPANLRRLQRLANLCMADNAPERSWAHNPQVLEEARTLINAYRARFADYRRLRLKLLATYQESFFELELERIAAGFAGPYQSWLRVFNGQYRRDRRAIRRRTHDVEVPATVTEDLLVARDLVAERRHLEEMRAKRKELLGRYENGLDTDLEAADRAHRVAVEALDLVRKLGCTSLPPRFLDALCAATPPPEKIQAAAKRLHDSLGPWFHLTQELKAVLPMDSLPGVGRPLEDCALSALNQYARDLQASLNRFGSLTDSLLSRTASPPTDAADLVADLQQAEEIRQLESSQDTEMARWQDRFGAGFRGLASDWNALKRGLSWSQRARDFFGGPPPERFVHFATAQAGPIPAPRDLRAALEQYDQAMHGLEARFDPPGPLLQGKRLADYPPEVILRRLTALRDRADDLAEWIEWRLLPTRFDHLGLDAFWEGLNRKSPPADRLQDVFMKSFLDSWVEAVCQNDAVLSKFHRPDHDKIVEEFQERDRAWVMGNGARVRARSSAALSAQAAPNQAGSGKVCVLATTAQASQLPPPDRSAFDVVILEGAGWMAIEDAVGVLARGRQLIVVGEEPSHGERRGVSHGERRGVSHGERRGVSHGERRGVSPTWDASNVLEASLAAALPAVRLRCHYRSRHDSLIAFVNQHFFDQRLALFPAAKTDHPDIGIQFHLVANGDFADGRNQPEAARVVELALAQRRAQPAKSLGIVALSVDQRLAIEDEVERRLLNEPDLGPLLGFQPQEGLVIADAESVQDEARDVIVLSVGFGRDWRGRLPAHWDPLDRETGPSLLRAALSLAREKMLSVSSLTARDLSQQKKLAEGVSLLGRFLDYAASWQTQWQPIGEKETHAPELSDIDKDIIGELHSRGYLVVPHVGRGDFHIDLAVVDRVDPGRFRLGILLDGPNYLSVATASERDRMHPQVLQELGWRLHRIWAPAWVHHHQEEYARLVQALDEAPKSKAQK